MNRQQFLGFSQAGARAQQAVDREIGKARSKDPDTAKAAARSVDATRLERMVLAALKGRFGIVAIGRRRGMTSEELANALGLPLVSVSPRLRPLANKGLVRDSGERRTTDSGRKAIVWVAE